MLRFAGEFVAAASERRERGGIAPVGGQACDFESFAFYGVGDFGNGEDQIIGRIIFVEVHEIFEHCEGLVLGSIAEAGSGARPASTEDICAFAAKGIAGESFS